MCAAVTAVATHPPASHSAAWALAGAAIGNSVPYQVLSLLLGAGFGLLFLNTPVAIVTYFVLPTAWTILTTNVRALHFTGNWLDPSTAWRHLSEATMTGATWVQTMTAAAVWVLLPVLAGSARVRRMMIS